MYRPIRKLKEAEVKALGGLSADDRELRGINEIADLGLAAVPAFKEARSLKSWLKEAKRACRSLREADSETALGFLVRKGVQTIANDWYRTIETVWRDVCLVSGSTTLAEWYAPLYPSTIAGPVERGGRFPESRIIGEDSVLRNQVFGQVVALERILFDDDQTGQIKDRSKALGYGMATLESVWWCFKYLGTERTYANVTVPASDYSTIDINGTTVSTPFSATLYGASLGNRAQSYGTLNIGHLKVAYQTLMNAVDPLQNKIQVDPNYLLVSTQDALNAKILTAQGYYPGVPGQSSTTLALNPVAGGTVSAAGANQGVLTGFPGGAFSPNPFGGLGWKVVVERYLPDWVWALGQSGRGIVFQERDPLEIIQEAPNSGNFFAFDQIQLRSRRRMQVDWVGGGSRFAFLGDDGTVTGNN